MPTFIHAGLTIHYRQVGLAHQPIALILPGNTASSAHHANELAFFHSLGYQAVAIDYPGTGRSDRLPRPWPSDWYVRSADACAALLDHLAAPEPAPALMCGTSGGAIVALWLAILYPEKVQAVIADSELMRFSSLDLRSIEADRAKRSSGQIAFWTDGHGDDWQEVVDADTEFFLNIEKSLAPGQTWEIHQGRLSEIKCPVLFTSSLTDDLIPEAGEQMLQMARQVPNSRYFCANQGSHPLMWSCPAIFQSAVRSFLMTPVE